MITPEHFLAAVGHEPQDDDLARANCEHVGSVLHSACGWCDEHDKPRFICGCLVGVVIRNGELVNRCRTTFF